MVNLTSGYEQELPRQHFHYDRLQRQIRESMPRIKITSIRQVHNKYLSLAFTVRENEIRRRNGGSSTIKEYIHATGATKVASILRGNLDWRLVTRSKYGRGVSFSHSTFYANKYCNNRNGSCRAFIFCDVLVGQRKIVYDNNDTHPPEKMDSYQSSTGFVLVKFDDFTFNPKFVVYYEVGGYDINSYPYNDNFRQRDFNDSFVMDPIRNQEQRVFLQQILRIPFKNEDFLNAIVAENNKRIRTIVQPTSSRLPNRSLVMPKDAEKIEVDAKRPVTENDSKRIEEDTKRPVMPNGSQEIEVDTKRSELPSTEDFTKIPQITFPGIRTPTTYHSSISNSVEDSSSATYSLGRFAEPITSPNACENFCLIMLISITAILCIGAIFYGLSW